jgi:flavorubredoxin
MYMYIVFFYYLNTLIPALRWPDGFILFLVNRKIFFPEIFSNLRNQLLVRNFVNHFHGEKFEDTKGVI